VVRNKVPGDFVECGVWKGGSAMLIARILHQAGIKDRKIYLYDTYEGMSDPSEADADFKGKSASSLLNTASKEDQASVWCYAPYEEVFNNMVKTGIDPENIVMVKGKVEETIPAAMPESAIALLRLDTDWYESTLHELNHLFPQLSPGGVLIVDDYGHWQGCRKAVDEYFEKNNINFLLNRIDYTGRVGVKSA
jgi:O-methyltransferase